MRRTSNALWIVGIILLAIGFLIALYSFGSMEEEARFFLLVFAGIFFIPGIIMTVVGLVRRSNVQRSNEAFLRRYHGALFDTTCFYCGHEIECTAEDFSIHRNYPEGFVYCPICRKPLSKKLFEVVEEQENVQKHNDEYSKKYKDKRYITTCFNCKREVKVRPEQFQPHRNYPEGYVYCPFCRKPLSKRAFDAIDEQEN